MHETYEPTPTLGIFAIMKLIIASAEQPSFKQAVVGDLVLTELNKIKR